jgi:hypothetical protein
MSSESPEPLVGRLATFQRKIDVFGSTVNGFGRAKTAGLPAVFFEGLC